MSGTFVDEGPEDRAGLYVLGTLDAAEMLAVRRDAERDSVLAASIAAWERRLAPLAALAGEIIPPAELWPAIEARIGAGASVTRLRPNIRAEPRALAYWRATAVASMAMAAGLAGLLIWRGQPLAPVAPPRLAMILPMQQTQGGWLIELKPDGTLHAIAQGGVTHAADRDFELWALAEKATRPVPLGLLPTAAAAADLRPTGLPAQKFKLLVSLEPRGGSPTGLPTGPVLFAGDVVEPRG